MVTAVSSSTFSWNRTRSRELKRFPGVSVSISVASFWMMISWVPAGHLNLNEKMTSSTEVRSCLSHTYTKTHAYALCRQRKVIYRDLGSHAVTLKHTQPHTPAQTQKDKFDLVWSRLVPLFSLLHVPARSGQCVGGERGWFLIRTLSSVLLGHYLCADECT